jgi:hypothetical protein
LSTDFSILSLAYLKPVRLGGGVGLNGLGSGLSRLGGGLGSLGGRLGNLRDRGVRGGLILSALSLSLLGPD